MRLDALRGPVLVATDLRPPADEALRQADALAPRGRTPLHVCHVLPEVLRVRMLFPQLHEGDASALQELERKAAAIVSERVEQLTGRAGADCSVSVEMGSAPAGILRHARHVGAALIVIGPGSTAAQVARGAECPVLVVRASGRGKVLGATDFSDPSLPALDAAACEASRRGVPLALIHCINLVPVDVGIAPGLMPLPIVAPGALVEARQALAKELEAFARKAGIEAECIVKEAYPASAILEAARDLPAELVVVGTHGRTGLTRMALGSVAESVASSAPCSVLVVRLGAA